MSVIRTQRWRPRVSEICQIKSKRYLRTKKHDVYDVIVIGAGVMGSFVTHDLSSFKKVLCLEQFEFYHVKGSSHGRSRIYRSSDPDFEIAEMGRMAIPLWRQVEKVSGMTFLKNVGVLHYGKGDSDEFEAMLEYSRKEIVYRNSDSCTVLSNVDINRRWPGIQLDDSYAGVFHKEGGLIDAEVAQKALHKVSLGYGAELKDNQKVLGFEKVGDHYVVRTENNEFLAKKVVIATGAYTDDLVETENEVWKMSVAFWKVSNPSLYADIPAFINYSDNFIYGFPMYEKPGYIKVGLHNTKSIGDHPRDLKDEINVEMIEEVGEFLKKYYVGIEKWEDPFTCLYTMTPDLQFGIKYHPNYDKDVVICAGFNGIGFKNAPIVSKTVVSMLFHNNQ